MLFNLTHSLPEKCLIAVSGGVDSMCVAHWLIRGNLDRIEGIVNVNHGTAFSARAAEFVGDYFTKNSWGPVFTEHIIPDIPKGKSKEEYWREERYRIFAERSEWENCPIILAHNFDDCVEEYIMCTMVRGREGTIPYKHENCIRPFRLWKRQSILAYAKRHKIPFLEDPSNIDVAFKRNFIRHLVVPRMVELNPGIHKIVEKMIKKQDEFDGNVSDL